jgi:hypothetical protein
VHLRSGSGTGEGRLGTVLELLAGRSPGLNGELLLAGVAKPDEPPPDRPVLAFNAIDGMKGAAAQVECFGPAERVRTFHLGNLLRSSEATRELRPTQFLRITIAHSHIETL